MNKDLLNQLAPDEQPVASKLLSAAEQMNMPQTFESTLETHLMDAYKNKTQPARDWHANWIKPFGWAVLALLGVFLLNWSIRYLIPAQPAAPTTAVSFETNVRQGNMCTGTLTLAHGFSVFMSNQDKTGFVPLDEQKAIGELRSFAWSPDGKQQAVVGNTTGTGNIYLTDSTGSSLHPVLSDSSLGYLMDAAWSHDGKQLLTWSTQNNTAVYVMNVDGTSLAEKEIGKQFFATPQFSPDNQSIIFYGADSSSAGLFEVKLDGSQTRTISTLVEDESGFAVSPDGAHLAYFEMDRTIGEAHLVVQEFATGTKTTIGTLSIPKGSGSSLPTSANLSWSNDGSSLVFDFGRSQSDRAIYLSHADGNEFIKVANSAYAPAISMDGKCLAYISNKQVFLMDLNSMSSISPASAPIRLAEIPAGRAIADFRMDKLGWGSGTTP